MNTEPIIPAKKPRNDSRLKNLSLEKREGIAEFAQTHSLVETRDWLAKDQRIKCSLSTVSRFLSWYRAGERVERGESAVEALVERLQNEHPDWTPEKIRALGQAYFALMALEKDDVAGWWRVQQINLRYERLQFDREKHQRNFVEEIVDICNDPKVRPLAEDDDLDYGDKIKQMQKVMFGEPNLSPESKVHPAVQGQGSPKSGEATPPANIQHSSNGKNEANIQHSVAEGMQNEAPTTKLQAPSTINAQPSTSQCLTPDTSHLKPLTNIQQPVAEGTQSEAPTSKDQAPEKQPNSECGVGSAERPSNNQPASSIKHPVSSICPPSADPQLATCNLQPATKVPSDEGSLTVEQAEKVVSAWKAKVKSFGAIIINQWDVAELQAYLSGQPTKWFSLKIHDFEIMHPPTRDPRHNSASPWCRAWKRLEQDRRANEKN